MNQDKLDREKLPGAKTVQRFDSLLKYMKRAHLQPIIPEREYKIILEQCHISKPNIFEGNKSILAKQSIENV